MINFSRRNIIIAAVVLILAIAIPVTMRLVQRPQQLKSKAATATCQEAAASEGYPLGICTAETDRSKLPNCPNGPYFPPEENPIRNINCDQYCYFCGEKQSPGGGGGVTSAARCTASWSPSTNSSGSVTAKIFMSDGSADLGEHTYDNVLFKLNGQDSDGLTSTGSVGVYNYNIACRGQGQTGVRAQLFYPSVNKVCEGETTVNIPVCPGSGPGGGGGGSGGTNPATTPPGGSISFNSGQTDGTVTKNQQVTINYSAWSNSGSPLTYVDIFQRCTDCSDTTFKQIGNRRVPQNSSEGQYLSDTVPFTPTIAGKYQVVVNVAAQDGGKCSGNPDHPAGWPSCGGNGGFFTLKVIEPASIPTPTPPPTAAPRGAAQTICGVTAVPAFSDPARLPTACNDPGQYLQAYNDGSGLVSACRKVPNGFVKDPNTPDSCTIKQAGSGGGQTATPTPGSASLACSKFELNGLSSSGTNSEGGPVYTAPTSGSNNQINLTFTPDNAAVSVSPTTQTPGAPNLNIAETNIGSTVVRTVNIPPNTSLTTDNVYMIRAMISSDSSQVNCLPIQVVVPKAASGSECPADITSTEVKFKNSDNSGSWVKEKVISKGGQVLVGGFHNGVTNTIASDVALNFSGPQGFSGAQQNGATFKPPDDLPPGVYTFTATTIGKAGNNCTGSANLTVLGATPPPPPPAESTQCVVVSEDKLAVDAVQSCNDPLARPYTSQPLVISAFTFTDKTPGIKTVFVKYISDKGRKQSEQASINFNPAPTLANAVCTQSSSGTGTEITIFGNNLGSQGSNGAVKVGNLDATVINWDNTSNVINAHVDQKLTGKNDVVVTLDDGRVAKSTCTVNTVTVNFKAAFACKDAGTFATDNVDVKVFEAVPSNSQNPNPEPVLHQTIRLNGSGEPSGFAPVFEKNKKYEFIIKAPGALAKRVDFDTTNGGTINLNGGNPIFLPQGDIAPVAAPDGRINAFDKSELMRQWSLVTDVTRTGDLNGDGRVNSVDYACMRPNINQSDDVFSPINPPASPSARPIAVPSSRGTTFASPTPVPAVSGAFFQVSFDPLFSANQIISQGPLPPTGIITVPATLSGVNPGTYTVYVRIFQNGAWGPTFSQQITLR